MPVIKTLCRLPAEVPGAAWALLQVSFAGLRSCSPGPGCYGGEHDLTLVV